MEIVTLDVKDIVGIRLLPETPQEQESIKAIIPNIRPTNALFTPLEQNGRTGITFFFRRRKTT
jgi:hypothetical protein